MYGYAVFLCAKGKTAPCGNYAPQGGRNEGKENGFKIRPYADFRDRCVLFGAGCQKT